MINKSIELFERAQRSIPGGVNSPVRAFKGVGGTPIFIKEAKGPYLFDEDGNKVEGSFFGKLKPKALTKTATGDRGSLLKTDSAPKELTTAEKETKDKDSENF